MSNYVCLPTLWLHHAGHDRVIRLYNHVDTYLDSKVHGDNMGPIAGRQDPGRPHVGPMNLVIRVYVKYQAGMQDMHGLITHVLHINHF